MEEPVGEEAEETRERSFGEPTPSGTGGARQAGERDPGTGELRRTVP